MTTSLAQLLPGRRGFDGADIIFTMNAAAQRRAAAGAAVINATVGALLDEQGALVVLPSVMAQYAQLTPKEIGPYAPIAGDPSYLLALTQRHWPTLTSYGQGAATPGGSGALALSLRNLLEPGQQLLTMAPYWGPYATLAQENGVSVVTVPMPEHGASLDAATWRTVMTTMMASQGRVLLWLNDPCHNPTGRSLTGADRQALLTVLDEVAAQGPVTLLLDLAYLDYARDPEAVASALQDYADFAVAQAARDGGVLVGACLSLSKAFTIYGARAGALVFPWCTDASLGAALATTCRGTWSNCPRAPMHVLLRLVGSPEARAQLASEHRRWRAVLTERADALDAALRAEGHPGAAWDGGFFVVITDPDPTGLCARLQAHDVFTVPIPEGLRVGICGMKAADAPRFAAALMASRQH